MAATQRPLSELAFSEPTGVPAWKKLPSWAVVATGDKVVGTDAVRSMAERAGATITEVEGSHVIMMSRPQVVAETILTALAASARKPPNSIIKGEFSEVLLNGALYRSTLGAPGKNSSATARPSRVMILGTHEVRRQRDCMGLLGGSGGKDDKDEGEDGRGQGRMKEAGGALTGDKGKKREGRSE